jgi:TolB-like protein/Tfp pilus assembly protein PilF
MQGGRIKFGDFELDLERGELSRRGTPVRIGSRAFDILRALASARGEVVSKNQLMQEVWHGVAVEENAIPVHISALRKALSNGDDGKSHIVTAQGRGYRLVGVEAEARQTGLHDAQHEQALTLPGSSIAVLPFANMSGDPEQEYFADGIVDDIITGLSQIKWLSVIARNSSFVYKNKAVDVKQIGRELGVRYVLEGSVRKARDRVRITTQLIDARTGVHLWAERYDRAVNDIFAVQDEIAMNVVGTIEPNLRNVEIERIKRKRPESLDAYDLVLRALPHMTTYMVDGAAAAIPLLQKALKLDPSYAGAHALLARCFHFRFSRGGLREEDRSAAIRHARAAMHGGSDDPTTLAIAALVIWFDEHDVTTAFELFDRALGISNSNVVALSASAFVLAWMGNTELALERAQRALRLSPFDTLNSYLALAVAHFHAQRYEAARDASRRAVESNPLSSIPHVLLAVALVRLRRLDEARVAAQHAIALDPTFTMPRWSVTVGVAPEVFGPFAEAWGEIEGPDR